jgi:Fe-coproporphyrin III synthase
MSELISRLPIVILDIHSRCNCRCAMCDIWKTSESREMPLSFVEKHVASMQALGVEWVVLSGGEPLMHSGVFEICKTLRTSGFRVTLLTSGLLIERFAGQIASHVDDVIVSLDGPAAIHDRIRGVPGAFALISHGISQLRHQRPEIRIAARCTVQKANHGKLRATASAANELGLDSISYLAVDLASTAFNRLHVWDDSRQAVVSLTPAELEVLRVEIDSIIATADPIVADTPAHLRRILHRFRAYAGLEEHIAPRCNAPWVSAVIELDGAVRPCFFHPPVARSAGDLGDALNSHAAVSFRRSLNVEENSICRQCVCSLYRQSAVA